MFSLGPRIDLIYRFLDPLYTIFNGQWVVEITMTFDGGLGCNGPEKPYVTQAVKLESHKKVKEQLIAHRIKLAFKGAATREVDEAVPVFRGA